MHVHYRPGAQVLDRLGQVDFVGVVGPTAVGKTTLIESAMAVESSIRMVTFTTSRQPRIGERDGIDYHFCSPEAMKARIAHAEYVNVAPNLLGGLYASAPEDYATQGVAVAAVLADAVPTFRCLPFASCRIVFVLPPDWDAWQSRLKSHQFSREQMQRRLAEARRSLDFALDDRQTTFVVNDNLRQATKDFAALALVRPLPRRLATDQDRAKKIAATLRAKLI